MSGRLDVSHGQDQVRPGRPWGVYAALAVLSAIMLLGVALPRRHGALFPVTAPLTPLQTSRQIRFVELPADLLLVQDASTGQPIARINAGQNGFLHAVVHGLSVTRHRAGVALSQPYGLSLYEDGRLVLTDPPTGTSIDMEGFGPTNSAGVLAFLARPQGLHP